MVAPPPLVFLGPLALGLLLQRFRPARLLPPGLARPVGLPLLLGGLALSGSVFLTFRRAETPLNPRRPVRRLVTGGPFRFSRNPSYLGMALMYLGIAALANARWPVFLSPLALLAMQKGVIEREERYLERRFGPAYTAYKQRVRRWL